MEPIEMNVMPRQSGKTTRAIQLMKQDSEAILILPNLRIAAFYPKELKGRIMTIDEVCRLGGMDGIRFSKFIIDEGLLLKKSVLARFYYFLGYHRYKAVVFGTDSEHEA